MATLKSKLMGKLPYFAYGSNMSLARIRKRVPSAARVGTCRLPQHRLEFHKIGADGSAKCDALYTGNPKDQLHGALYLIDPEEKVTLDKVEGLGAGYEEKTVQLQDHHGQAYEAYTYYATHVDPGLMPFAWYVNHVVVGAHESTLPSPYIADLEATQSIKDPDAVRAARERGIYH